VDFACPSALQCIAACCSVLQCVAVCCSALQCVAVCCSVLRDAVLSGYRLRKGADDQELHLRL